MSLVRKHPVTGYAMTGELGSGTADTTTFLRGDNTWVAAGGGGLGSVTVVTGTAPIAITGVPGVTPNVTLVYDSSLGVSGGSLQRAALSGDVSAPAGSNTTTLATVNSNVGSFTYASVTVNAKGLVTAASSGATPALAARTLTAGAGLTGGGDLSADRTFNVGQNADASITVNADDIQLGSYALVSRSTNAGPNTVNLGALTTGLLKITVAGAVATPSTAVANTDYVATSRTISTTAPITGGGDLSANRTIGITLPAAYRIHASDAAGTNFTSSDEIRLDTDSFWISNDGAFVHQNSSTSGFQSANYERVRSFWNSNVWNLKSEKGGSGTVRSMLINADTATLTLNGATVAVDGSTGINLGSIAGTGQVGIAAGTSITAGAGSGIHPSTTFTGTRLTIDTSTPSIAAGVATDWDGLKVTGAATLTGAGTVNAHNSTTFAIPTITGTGVGATVIEAATVAIDGKPSTSGITVNLGAALWVKADHARFDGGMIIPTTANGSVATVLGSLGPAGSHTTVQAWLKVQDTSLTDYYIPMF